MANKLSLEYINNKYKDFATRFSQLQIVMDETEELSYTQWEAYLAAYHGKYLFIVSPSATVIKDSKYIKDEAQAILQAKHLNNLKGLGHHAEIHFNNEDELAKKLYQSKLGEIIFGAPKHKPANLPYHSIGDVFKGREDFIEDLYKTLNKITGITGIAIHALGGMGKTRLVVEYARKYFYDYTALLFVNANSPELLKANIAALAAPDILNLPENAQQDEAVKYAAVKNWLNENIGWLLILDNVDTNEAAEKTEEVFAAFQQGHIVITTRISNWSGQINKKQLGVLDNEAATKFLLETTDEGREKKENDNETAKLIAHDLGYLALALEQARAYIITKELSFENYRKAWQANRVKVMEWFNKQQMQYHASVAITWQTSFSQLSAAATILLNRLVWLSPEPIPKTLLEVEIPDLENIDAISAWVELKQYSLATSADDKKTFTIHKLVQDVTRGKMDEALKLQTLNEALNWIDTAFTGDATNFANWIYMEPLVSHTLYLIDYAEKNLVTIPISNLMNQVAGIFWVKAQFDSAEILIRKKIEIDEQNFGLNHHEVATGINNLAQLLQDTNRLQEAEPLMRRALAIDEQSFGDKHPNVAIRLNNLAQLLKATNRLQEAEPLMRRALQIDEQSFGKDHPKVAIRLNNFAQLLQATNRLQEAEPLMRRALAIDEQSFGKDHPNVAIDLNNLAQFLQDTDRLQEAEPLMRRALQIDEQSFGDKHPNVARDLNNLATLLKDTNRWQEAEPLMRRALAIDEQSFGKDHPKVAIRLNNLATLLQDTNRLQEAEPLMKRSVIIFLNSYGEDHPSTQTIRNNYIYLLQEMGNSEEEIKAILSELF